MLSFRPFQPEDLEALYEISLRTGLAGGDASGQYQDTKLIGHIYSAPYALLEPGLAIVAMDEEGVGGYAVGTEDTTRWEARLEEEWWPRLRTLYTKPCEDAVSLSTADERRIAMIFQPEQTPAQIAADYPAHLHMNLLPRLQGKGVGARLLAAWMSVAQGHGVKALHVGVNRANSKAIRFWRRQDFEEIPTGQPEQRTLWMGFR